MGVHVQRHRRLRVAEPAADDMDRQAFERIASGEEQETVRRDLNEAGLRTGRGHPVSRATFHRLLRNPAYMGRIVIDKLGLDCPARFEPLVDPALYGVVQGRLGDTGTRRYAIVHPDFPLRRFACCGHCGSPMTGGYSRSKNGNRYGYYNCRTCRGQGVSRSHLHVKFRELLAAITLHEDLVPFVRLAVLDAFEVLTSRSRFELHRLTRDLAQMNERLDKLEDAYIYEKRISQDTYDKQHSRLLSEQQRLGTRIAMLSSTEAHNPEQTVDRALAVLTNPTEIWNTAETHARRAFQRLLYPQGVKVLSGEF